MKYVLILLSFAYSFCGFTQAPFAFDYSFSRDTASPQLLRVSASITNDTAQNRYFFAESCNGLLYYVSTSSPKATVNDVIKCFLSLPEKRSLAAGETYSFSFNVRIPAHLNELAIRLSLYELDENERVENQEITTIIARNKANLQLLEGPLLPIPSAGK